jgi:hypothetical protein
MGTDEQPWFVSRGHTKAEVDEAVKAARIAVVEDTLKRISENFQRRAQCDEECDHWVRACDLYRELADELYGRQK